MNHRELWIPKHPELSEQCASCPFRKGNDKEFAAIVRKLRKKLSHTKTTKFDVAYARMAIYNEVVANGEFSCHHTVYDEASNIKPPEEFRQCPGATKYYREAIKTKPEGPDRT